MMITDELKLKNYSLFILKLQQIGIDTTILEEKYKEQLINAIFNLNSGGEGSLLQIVMRTLTPNALKLAELNKPEKMSVDTNTVIKVCLLMHLSKVTMFQKGKTENTFTYAPYPYGLKMGLRSIAMCEECGIHLTAEEIEAITILDRETEEQAKFFASPLATIIKIANELTFLHIKFI